MNYLLTAILVSLKSMFVIVGKCLMTSSGNWHELFRCTSRELGKLHQLYTHELARMCEVEQRKAGYYPRLIYLEELAKPSKLYIHVTTNNHNELGNSSRHSFWDNS